MILKVKNPIFHNILFLKQKIFIDIKNYGVLSNKLCINHCLKIISNYEINNKAINGPSNFKSYKGKQYFHSNPVLNNSNNQRKLLDLNPQSYTNSYRNYGKPTYYLQNPFKWLNNNIKFEQTKRHWDNSLDKEEFLQGSKLAVVSILQEIKERSH